LILKLVVALSFLSFTACQQTNSNATAGPQGFQKAQEACEGQVVKNEYLVHWKNGAMTKEFARSDEAFQKEFLAANLADIQFAEPNYKVSIPEKITSMSIAKITQPDNWGPIRIHADAVWQTGDYGQNVIVAVIDTGVERTNDQLKNQLALNSGEMGTDAQGKDKSSNGIDDDANGFVDDWNGYNFVANSGDASDDNGHGTHVSGIIAAEHHDTVAQAAAYVQGIAPGAKILPLKFLDAQGSGDVASSVSAIDYAVSRGAKVINASWGGTDCSLSLKNKIGSLVARNILFVAAAGNDGVNLDVTQRFPASFDFLSQITVGATGLFDAMADFSNYGDTSVHLFAPGAYITSTYLNDSFAALSGTSMATPFVTGAAALLFSHSPNADLSAARAALMQTTVVNADYHNQSKGRLDLSALIPKLNRN
jgi:subtilisin family serine protease